MEKSSKSILRLTEAKRRAALNSASSVFALGLLCILISGLAWELRHE